MSIINFFVIYGRGIKKKVSYDSSMTLRDFLLDYLKKNNFTGSLDKRDYIIKNGDLCLNHKLDIKLEELIEEDEVIDIDKCAEINLGGGLSTVDVSKNITREYEPGNSGLFYRQGCDGLNIQSKCKNKNCTAYNDTIYVKIGYVEQWNLLDHLEDRV